MNARSPWTGEVIQLRPKQVEVPKPDPTAETLNALVAGLDAIRQSVEDMAKRHDEELAKLAARVDQIAAKEIVIPAQVQTDLTPVMDEIASLRPEIAALANSSQVGEVKDAIRTEMAALTKVVKDAIETMPVAPDQLVFDVLKDGGGNVMQIVARTT